MENNNTNILEQLTNGFNDMIALVAENIANENTVDIFRRLQFDKVTDCPVAFKTMILVQLVNITKNTFLKKIDSANKKADSVMDKIREERFFYNKMHDIIDFNTRTVEIKKGSQKEEITWHEYMESLQLQYDKAVEIAHENEIKYYAIVSNERYNSLSSLDVPITSAEQWRIDVFMYKCFKKCSTTVKTFEPLAIAAQNYNKACIMQDMDSKEPYLAFKDTFKRYMNELKVTKDTIGIFGGVTTPNLNQKELDYCAKTLFSAGEIGIAETNPNHKDNSFTYFVIVETGVTKLLDNAMGVMAMKLQGIKIVS